MEYQWNLHFLPLLFVLYLLLNLFHLNHQLLQSLLFDLLLLQLQYLLSDLYHSVRLFALYLLYHLFDPLMQQMM